MNKTKLTPRQLQLLRHIKDFRTTHGYSPTIDQLANIIRISKSTAFGHIAELRKKRMLKTDNTNKARSLIPTQKALNLLKRIEQNAIKEPPPQNSAIPLLGRIAAGQPIQAIQNKDYLSFDELGNTSDTFALKVTGDSMIEEGIFEGDYIICKNAPTAHNGQLVVAVLDDNTVTLKRFYKEKKHIRLQPANSAYKPIYTKNCRIQAIATGLIRKL